MNRLGYRGALHLALIATLSVNPCVRAASETFNTALPLANGDFVYRQMFLAMRTSDDPTPTKRDERALGGMTVLGYGVTADLALFGALPYFDKRVDFTMDGARIGRSAQGIGDATALGRYTVYADNAAGRTFRISPFAGVQMPTGKDNTRDRFGALPRDLQVGTGAWDPLAGVVATLQTFDYELDAQVQYRANTSAEGFAFGNEARLDGSLQYRLWPRTLGRGLPGFLYGVIEANLIHQDHNRAAGLADPNSGGTVLFIDPGLQYVTRKWVLEAIAPLPAVQNLNGTGVRNDYAVLFGFRVNL